MAPLSIGESEPSRSPWNDDFEFTKWSFFGWAGSLCLVVGQQEANPACGRGVQRRLVDGVAVQHQL
eukprot:8640314-Pyramimonas_sp.AAC.1